MSAMDLPVIDLEPYIKASARFLHDTNMLESSNPADNLHFSKLCAEVSRSLKEKGALLIKDPRCSAEDNSRFVDMMERYFEKHEDFKLLQERPHLHYQVGVTPGVEFPRSFMDEEMKQMIRMMPEEYQPAIPTGADPKWRYMWRIGSGPAHTHFQELNSQPVIPEGFPEWEETMDSWGYKMISAIEVVAEMAALGFGLPKDAFTSLMKQLFSHVASDAALKPLGHFANAPLSSKDPAVYAGDLVEQELAVINLKRNTEQNATLM